MSELVKVTFFLVLIVIIGCQSHPYQEMEESGLASGVRYDSAIMGLKFGMSLSDFYDHCMGLNRQKLVYQGPGSRIVEYVLVDGVKSPVTVQFQPEFHEDQLYEVKVSYAYQAWAPWNREYASDYLIEEIKSLFERDFGGGFVTIEHPQRPSAYAKVDGNRRISISVSGEVKVVVRFTDLLISKHLKKQDL